MVASRFVRPASRLTSSHISSSVLRSSPFQKVSTPVVAGSKWRRSYAAASGVKEMTVRDALNEAMAEEMEKNDKVFVLGEEVAQYNGAYKVTKGLLDRFGEKRVIDSPITESGFCGLTVGAALAGLHPIVSKSPGILILDRHGQMLILLPVRVHDLQLCHAGH